MNFKQFDAIIDVRSPAEFAEDHIPGAISAPVLDDEERAKVGTLYKQVSAFDAKMRSEERRVGKECHVVCRSRWSPYH